LWQIFCKKNPSFSREGNVTMSSKGLKKLFDTTWDMAFYEGEDEYEDVEKTSQSFQQQSASVDILKSMFGMR
jgi:hypothetical protein